MQTTIFDMLYPKFRITKPIRLIEFFAGYGSQALALKYLGVPFEHWKICEWAVKSIQAYKDIHFTNEKIDTKIYTAENFFKSISCAVFGILAAFLLDRLDTAICMIAIGSIFGILITLVSFFMKKRVGLSPNEYSKDDIKYDKLKYHL